MNIKFYVKLGKNASDICALLPEVYGRETEKIQMFLSGINGSKGVARTWKTLKEVVQDFTEPMKILKNCSI
jgi:hypothetical protein